jgi:hypothetical protein
MSSRCTPLGTVDEPKNAGTLFASGPSAIGVGGVAASAAGANINPNATTAKNDRLNELASKKSASALVSLGRVYSAGGG